MTTEGSAAARPGSGHPPPKAERARILLPGLAALGLLWAAILLQGPHAGRMELVAAGGAVTLLLVVAGAQLLREKARLRRSAETLALAVETMDQGLIVLDRERRVLAANRRAEALLGLPPGLAAPGRPAADILDHQAAHGEFGTTPEEIARFRRLALEEDGTARIYRRTRPDGTVLEIRSRGGSGGLLVRTYADVTADVRAEAMLAEARDAAEAARALLAAAVENVPAGILMTDTADRILVMNRRAVELLGLPPELARPGGDIQTLQRWQLANDRFRDDPAALERARWGAAHVGVIPGTFERRMPGGRVLEVRSLALPGGGGISTYTDITDRKQAEAALTATLENVSQGVLMVDPQGVVRVVNQRVNELLGLPDGLCAPGRPFRDVYLWQAAQAEFAGDSALPELPLDQVLEFMLREEVYERRRPDGTWLEIRTRRLPDGMLVRTFADVTARRGAIDDLAAAEAALSVTIENVGHGIMTFEADGTLRVVNRLALELLDLPAEVARPGRNVREILDWQIARGDFAGQPEAERIARAEVADFALGPMLRERRGQDGRVIEIRTLPLPGGGAVRTFTDVTAAREAEAALAAARDAAEAAARARSEFIAVMSHEIRTPLNGILGLSGMLLDAGLPAEQQRQVRLLRESGEHLLALLNDVLDISRFEAGRLELEETPFAPREEVAAAIDLAAARAQAKGLALSADIAPAVPARLAGDPGRLRQVLLNLLDNAVKFTEAGSVRVEVAPLGREGGRVRLGISVRDSGIGVPEAARARLFSDFAQADSSISRRYGGSGLGLAICRRLVQAMGGTLSVEDAPGGGSIFRFDILLREAPDAPAPPPSAPPSCPAGGTPRLRVLLAEDNNTNRLVLTHMLERMGHRVDAVGDGREALEAVQARPYDLVVMDMMMPEMDGLAATRAIRALPGPAARVPVIGLTANADAAAAAACLAAGMDRHEAKPIAPARLSAAIAAVAPAPATPALSGSGSG